MKYLLVFLITFFVAGCNQSSDVTKTENTAKTAKLVKTARGTVFEYGIYNAQRKGRILGNLTTNTGKVVTRPVLELSDTTNRIPLKKNTYFAYRYRLLDLPKEEAKKPIIELRKVLLHPLMTLPDGTTSTGWDRIARSRTSSGQVIAFDGYVFNEDYELVEGEWTFQIWFREQKLVEQTFTTYQPEDVRTEAETVISKAESKI